MDTDLFDEKATVDRLGGDESLFRELAQYFIEDSPGLLDQVRLGVQKNDAEAVERAAHSLKGLAGNFGATRAREAALAVERLGRGGNLGDAARSCAELQQEIELLQRALAPYCSNSTAP